MASVLGKLSGGAAKAEAQVLEAISGVQGRGAKGLGPEQLAAFEAAVEKLEADGGVKAPTNSQQLDGRWRLLYTSKPGTASPIQRTFTGVDAFSIFQDITLRGKETPTIVNVVEFGGAGVLRVEAEANTDARPLPGFTPRKGAGIPLFGKSSTYPPPGPNVRVDFQFSRAAFDFKALPFKIPYPVPFKLLGDETKGFIDITYLSPRKDGIRLARGNKGTLFVLQKEGPVPSPAAAAKKPKAGATPAAKKPKAAARSSNLGSRSARRSQQLKEQQRQARRRRSTTSSSSSSDNWNTSLVDQIILYDSFSSSSWGSGGGGGFDSGSSYSSGSSGFDSGSSSCDAGSAGGGDC